MKYYYMKFRDRTLETNHKGFYSQAKVDEVFDQMAPDGYKRNIIIALVGPLNADFINEQRKKHRVKVIV